jgi:hypothetical protein
MTTGLQWRLYEKRGSRQRKHLLAQQSAPQYAVTWMSDVGALEQTQLQLNLGDSRFRRVVIPFVSAGQEAGRHDTSPVDGSA